MSKRLEIDKIAVPSSLAFRESLILWDRKTRQIASLPAVSAILAEGAVFIALSGRRYSS